MISVLVVDDQPLVRQAVRDILVDGGIAVVGEAANGREAVRRGTVESHAGCRADGHQDAGARRHRGHGLIHAHEHAGAVDDDGRGCSS